MKKISIIILCFALLLSFSACKGEAQKETTEAFSTDLTETTTAVTEITTETTTTAVETTTQPTTESTSAETTTEVVTTTEAVTTTEENKNVCFFSIDCRTILENEKKLKEKTRPFVPSDGIIISKYTCKVYEGDTVLEVLLRACEAKGVDVAYTDMPMFNSCYIEGIGGIFEKDCGGSSGWMYSVNGEFPQVGANAYTVSAGDEITFVYTCDGGMDIGDR